DVTWGTNLVKLSFDFDCQFLLDFDNSAIFLAVTSLFFWQWQPSSLAVGTSSASGNSIPGKLLAKGNNGNEEAVTNKVKTKEVWRLFTDGSSNEGGSGATLILINPTEMEFAYALRFEFKASNNKAEYEALLAGLRIAEK
nr:reverse transcriptase domain-containing protein [Tanacetum cinerariifolium]